MEHVIILFTYHFYAKLPYFMFLFNYLLLFWSDLPNKKTSNRPFNTFNTFDKRQLNVNAYFASSLSLKATYYKIVIVQFKL